MNKLWKAAYLEKLVNDTYLSTSSKPLSIQTIFKKRSLCNSAVLETFKNFLFSGYLAENHRNTIKTVNQQLFRQV